MGFLLDTEVISIVTAIGLHLAENGIALKLLSLNILTQYRIKHVRQYPTENSKNTLI